MCQTCEHNIFTHFPKDPNCPICQANKPTRAYVQSKPGAEPDALPVPKAWGDAITADHKILNEDDQSRDHDRMACIILDRFTQWLQGYSAPSKSAAETRKAFRKFLGPEMKCKHIYTDNSEEFRKALKDLDLPHDTSTPYRSETNGVAERAVRRVKEGTACALSQSGLNEVWWKYAMQCFCFLRNIVDLLVGQQTAYKKRFGKDCEAPVIPFGAEIEYYPISPKDKDRVHQLGDKCYKEYFGLPSMAWRRMERRCNGVGLG